MTINKSDSWAREKKKKLYFHKHANTGTIAKATTTNQKTNRSPRKIIDVDYYAVDTSSSID